MLVNRREENRPPHFSIDLIRSTGSPGKEASSLILKAGGFRNLVFMTKGRDSSKMRWTA